MPMPVTPPSLLAGSVTVLPEVIAKPEKKGEVSNIDLVFLQHFATCSLLLFFYIVIFKNTVHYLDS